MDNPIGNTAAPTVCDRYRLNAQDLARGVALRLTVISGSMEPLIRPGDIVVTQPMENAPLRPGDVVVVQRGTAWVTHRVLRAVASGCSTQGDNSWLPDEPVALADVVGCVVSIERGTRSVDLQSVRWQRAGRILALAGRGKLNLLKLGRSQEAFNAPSSAAWRKGLIVLAVWPFQLFNRAVVWIMLKMD